jgi:hypothetical protein
MILRIPTGDAALLRSFSTQKAQPSCKQTLPAYFKRSLFGNRTRKAMSTPCCGVTTKAVAKYAASG